METEFHQQKPCQNNFKTTNWYERMRDEQSNYLQTDVE
jgi:hypothetical protein